MEGKYSNFCRVILPENELRRIKNKEASTELRALQIISAYLRLFSKGENTEFVCSDEKEAANLYSQLNSACTDLTKLLYDEKIYMASVNENECIKHNCIPAMELESSDYEDK